MSTKSVEFSSVELRVVMKFLFLQNKTPKEIHDCMMQTLSDKCPSYSTVKKWCANFQRGDFETDGQQDLEGLQRCQLLKLLIMFMT